jgi:hypothetical protein
MFGTLRRLAVRAANALMVVAAVAAKEYLRPALRYKKCLTAQAGVIQPIITGMYFP